MNLQFCDELAVEFGAYVGQTFMLLLQRGRCILNLRVLDCIALCKLLFQVGQGRVEMALYILQPSFVRSTFFGDVAVQYVTGLCICLLLFLNQFLLHLNRRGKAFIQIVASLRKLLMVRVDARRKLV